MKVNLHPKRFNVEGIQWPASDLATVKEVYDEAVTTYGDKARNLLDRSGSDPIGAISLLMLAADQRKTQQATEPSLSEQALAATVREQRDAIDTLKTQVALYRDRWQIAANNASRLFADLCQKEADADQITALESILRALTATTYGRARMYSYDLRALPTPSSATKPGEPGPASTTRTEESGPPLPGTTPSPPETSPRRPPPGWRGWPTSDPPRRRHRRRCGRR